MTNKSYLVLTLLSTPAVPCEGTEAIVYFSLYSLLLSSIATDENEFYARLFKRKLQRSPMYCL